MTDGWKLSHEDIVHIVRDVVDYGEDSGYIAKLYGISRRRVQQLCREYRLSGKVPELKRRGRKPYAKYPEYTEALIIELHIRYGIGASLIGKILRNRYRIRMDNNRIHEVLKMHGYACTEPNKRVRKKPWIRYERSHSLSAVHMDWYYNPELDVWACPVLDDASRYVLAMIETKHPTVEASIKVLDEAYHKFLHIRGIGAVIIDHGTQFYPNKRNKKGKAKHRFIEYCEKMNIKVIVCQYHHPQTNGKVERFLYTYQRFRHKFKTLEDFLTWYNSVRPHMSLDFEALETPEKALYRKAQDIILGNFWKLIENNSEVNTNA